MPWQFNTMTAMQTIPLWRHIIGGIIFASGLCMLVQSVMDVISNQTNLLSLDFIFALLVYVFSVLSTTAFVFPAKEKN